MFKSMSYEWRVSNMPTAKGFHIVLSEVDHRLVRHDELQVAVNEAKRLAEKEGKRFYVLTATDAYQPLEKTQQVSLNPPAISNSSDWGVVWKYTEA
jgi:hypothetical protein